MTGTRSVAAARGLTRSSSPAHDTLFGGRVIFHQPERGKGYRANVDALLLAAFAARGRRAHVACDLGAGAGAVSLALFHLDATEQAILVESDEEAAALARRNLSANGWSERGAVRCEDVANLAHAKPMADLVVCNPPYVQPGSGRAPQSTPVARARSGNLSVFVRAARYALRRRGRACFVFPAHELATLIATLRTVGLEPKRMRAVHATATSPARVVLVEASAGKRGGLGIEQPLVERQADGYSAELRSLLRGA